jgi:hypothetical protein
MAEDAGLPLGARERYARSLQERLLQTLEAGAPVHPTESVELVPTPRTQEEAAGQSPRLLDLRRAPAGLRHGGSSLRKTVSTGLDKSTGTSYLKRQQLQSPRGSPCVEPYQSPREPPRAS